MNGEREIRAILGPLAPEALGISLMHEHVLCSMSHVMEMRGGPASAAGFFDAPLSMEALGAIRFGRMVNREDCGLTDLETAIDEVALFRRAGGSLIVDASSIGLGRDPEGLAAVSRATGVQIMMGSSFYVEATWPATERVHERSEADIVERIVSEVMEGVDDTGLRAGLIGEVGCSWPLTEAERKVLRASAAAQRITGAPLMVHPGRHGDAPFEIVDELRRAGAELDRTILCHIDRTLGDPESLKRLADTGCLIEFDLFGMEHSYYPWSLPVDMPNDARRIDLLKGLIAQGHLAQLLVSQDICFRHRLVRYGGSGYAHLLANVVPLMRRKGMTKADIDTLMIENPRRILSMPASAAV